MRIVFMGTPESAVPSLRRLVDDGHEIAAVWTQPDKPSGRGNKLHQSPVKEFALQHNLPIHQPPKIKTPDAKALFASHDAEAAIVVAYGKILPSEFLNAYSRGCINVHFSLLPKYRGAAPVNWAIVNGEDETGVTTMKIVEELDAGPILLQKAARIEAEETAPQLLTRLAGIGAELLRDTLRQLDEIEPTAQLDAGATLAPMLTRQEGLIDWSMDASSIERRVRGFQPWPNAHTIFDSRRLIIWRGAPEPTNNRTTSPGQVIEAHAGEFVVACGQATALRILELQLQGGRRLSSRDFINGAHPKVGEIFL